MKKLSFGDGKVIYDNFSIDFGKKFLEQKNNLLEDLLQIEYNDGYLIDLGWYPEFNKNGKLVLKIIYNYDWANPMYINSFRTKLEFEKAMECAVNIINIERVKKMMDK